MLQLLLSIQWKSMGSKTTLVFIDFIDKIFSPNYFFLKGLE